MTRALPGPDSAMAPAIGRIRTRSSFRALARPDARATSGPLRVAFVQAGTETPGLACVGYAVGRRHGNAVARNRLRRQLRAALREVATGTPLVPGAYLVSARPDAADLEFSALRTALSAATADAARRARGRAGEAGATRADSEMAVPVTEPATATAKDTVKDTPRDTARATARATVKDTASEQCRATSTER